MVNASMLIEFLIAYACHLLFILIHLRQDAVLDLFFVPGCQDKAVINLAQLGKILVFVDFLGEFGNDDLADDLRT